MTTSLTLRSTKGSPLTNAEIDGNFTALRATADAALIRTQLTTTRIVWVIGSLSTGDTGGPSGGADFADGFSTIQKAIDFITKKFDGGGSGVSLANAIQIQVYAAGGPYTGAINVSGMIPGDGLIWIVGNGASVAVSNNHAFFLQNNCRVMFSDITISTTGSGAGILATTGASVILNSGITFGACAESHIDCSYGATIISAAGYTISGGAASHYHARNGGVIGISHAVTLTGTPAFSAYFAGASWGFLETIGATFTGSATGPRFTVHYGGVIRTVLSPGSSSKTYFPGSTAGVIGIGGQYDRFREQATVTLTDGASIATDATLVTSFIVTLGGNRTLANPTNLAEGQRLVWLIKQDATGGRTLAFGSAFKFTGGVAPTLTSAANSVDMITGYTDGTNIYATIVTDLR